MDASAHSADAASFPARLAVTGFPMNRRRASPGAIRAN
jgi:hypothetical protein